MSLKFRIVFYNVMIFLVIFDIIYLVVWFFLIEMNLFTAILVAGIAALLMPWARANYVPSKRKVMIRSLAYNLYRNFQNNKGLSLKNNEQTNQQQINLQ